MRGNNHLDGACLWNDETGVIVSSEQNYPVEDI